MMSISWEADRDQVPEQLVQRALEVIEQFLWDVTIFGAVEERDRELVMSRIADALRNREHWAWTPYGAPLNRLSVVPPERFEGRLRLVVFYGFEVNEHGRASEIKEWTRELNAQLERVVGRRWPMICDQ